MKAGVQIPSTTLLERKGEETILSSANLLSSQSFSCSPSLLNRINPFQELAVSPANNIHWLLTAWSCTQRKQCSSNHLHCFTVCVPSHLSTQICSDITSQSWWCYDHLFPENSPDRQCTWGCSSMKFKWTPQWSLQNSRYIGHILRLPMKGTSTPEHLPCEPQSQMINKQVKTKDSRPWS